jgi:predicted RNase H-like HicB family nuclease
MKVRIRLDREEDGRWIAEVRGLPGSSAGYLYGATRDKAVAAAKVLAFESLAESVQSGRVPPRVNGVAFVVSSPRRHARSIRTMRSTLQVLAP